MKPTTRRKPLCISRRLAVLASIAAVAALFFMGRGSTPVDAEPPTVSYFTLTVDNTKGGVALSGARWLTAGPAPTEYVTCEARLETAAVRYRYDGGAPTASEGVLLQPLELVDRDDRAFWTALRLIRTTSTSGTLKGHCRREP